MPRSTDTAADFASSAMLAVLGAGLRAQGVDIEAAGARPARVPRADKVDLLAAAVGRHGAGVLLRLDAGLDALAGQPLFQALLGGGRPWDVLARWGRLECYVHGRHRTRRVPQHASHADGEACRVEHHALDGSTPLALESLAVMAVQAALLRRAGALGLAARFDGVDLFGPGGAAAADALCVAGAAPAWVFEWRLGAARPPPAGAVPAAFDLAPDTVRAIARLVGTDLLRRWRLDDAAAALGRSARGLQRELAAQGWRFTAIVAQARQGEAARLLRESSASLAEIGYRCGYADQAHFNRQFERDVGMPPGGYRRAFARGAGSAARASRGPAQRA